MNGKSERDYIIKHRTIRDKLIGKSKVRERACFNVSELASELKMDVRTVRSHLRIMEVDAIGVFVDAGQKQFCTKDGIALLASMLRINEKSVE